MVQLYTPRRQCILCFLLTSDVLSAAPVFYARCAPCLVHDLFVDVCMVYSCRLVYALS